VFNLLLAHARKDFLLPGLGPEDAVKVESMLPDAPRGVPVLDFNPLWVAGRDSKQRLEVL
jgi:hypothetical protein